MAPRQVAIATKHTPKFKEFARHFVAYGINCIQIESTNPKDFKTWLKSDPKQNIAVLQEHTDLLSASNRSLIIDARDDPSLHLCQVIHLSSMKAWTITPPDSPDGRHLTYKDYISETRGYLDYTPWFANEKRPSDCYDWDDIFIIPDTGLSVYTTIQHLGHKVSSRDKNIAAFIQDRIYYKELCNLAFDPVNMKQPVDFSIDPLPTLIQILPGFMDIYKEVDIANLDDKSLEQAVVSFGAQKLINDCSGRWHGMIEENCWPEFMLSFTDPASIDPIKLLLHHVIINCLNTGVFLRAPENRREKLYWVPGLNSGLPLTKKKDQGHERIFRFHDCSHHGIPDLVFISPTNSRFPVDAKRHKATYVLHRLMTEAFSLATADMLGTHYLQTEWGQYESAYKRLIIQVYNTLPAEFREPTNLRELYYLIYNLVFYGRVPDPATTPEITKALATRVSDWYSKIAPESECQKAITDFLAKYRTYFLDDFYWTEANYEDMLSRSAEFDSLFETSSVICCGKNSAGPREGYYESSIINSRDSINQYLMDLIGGCCGDYPNISPSDSQTVLAEYIFTAMFDDYIDMYSNPDKGIADIFTPAIRTSIGFCRYMYGQSLIFKHFGFLPESDRVYNLINDTMQECFIKQFYGYQDREKQMAYTLTDMERDTKLFVRMIPRIRTIYNNYLDMLLSRNLITQDDRDTYKEVYPIFKPVIVNYDDATFDDRLRQFENFIQK
jgi:hypothetical protein